MEQSALRMCSAGGPAAKGVGGRVEKIDAYRSTRVFTSCSSSVSDEGFRF